MMTPGHAIINLMLLRQAAYPPPYGAIALGAIAPDLPIFAFYFISKFGQQLSETQIWTQAYYDPEWQRIFSLAHSIPLAAIVLLACAYFSWQPGVFLSLSAMLHSLCDLPVHHDDAHRHFYPFSNYRFVSPISYWDPEHHGRLVAAIELLVVAALSGFLINEFRSWFAKGVFVAIDLAYIYFYLSFYLLRR